MNAPKPVRLQRSRKKGAKLVSPNGLDVVCVTRPNEYGNPFKVGHRYIMGDPRPEYRGPFSMIYCEALVEDPRSTLIETAEQAVEWFRRLEQKLQRDLSPLRGKNLACFCKLPEPGKPDHCHAAVLIEFANKD